jgi:hypothetical protein
MIAFHRTTLHPATPTWNNPMSFPKRGSRIIIVGDARYRWMAKPEDDYPWDKVIVVEAEGIRNGQQLYCKIEQVSVTPACVSRLIQEALAARWAPEAKRLPPFRLEKEAIERACLHDTRNLACDGKHYCWWTCPEGGVHVQIDPKRHCSHGQILVTDYSLNPKTVNDAVVSEIIHSGLAKGWRPEKRIADCFWLSA